MNVCTGNPAHFKNFDDGVFDQIVRARRSGGDADDCRFRAQQEAGVGAGDFFFLVQVVVNDLIQ